MTEATSYHPVTPEVAEQLRAIVGERYVIYNDPEKLQPYSHDEIPDPQYAHMPEAVVRPETAEQVAALLQLANRALIPVTPRGAGDELALEFDAPAAPAAGFPAGPCLSMAASSCCATA